MMEDLKPAKFETPVEFEKGKTYQLFLRSRSFEWIVSNDIFNGLRVTKLSLDGMTKPEGEIKRIYLNLKSCKVPIDKWSNSYDRIGHSFPFRSDNIDLKEVCNALMELKPKTLFIKELECIDDHNQRMLVFRDKFMSDKNVRMRVEKSINDHASPLFLQRVYDLANLKEIKKAYFPRRKTATIVKGSISKQRVVKFTIVDDN